MASLRNQAIRAVMGVTLAAAAIAVAAPHQASAAEILPHEKTSESVNAILVKGAIVEGDTFDLQVYLGTLPKKPSIVVYLDSPGGNLAEGMRLGRFFHSAKIETVVPAKTRCTSACALAFLGGRDPVSGKPHRTKSSSGAVGFHAFTREFDKEKQYSAEDMKSVVHRTQSTVFAVAEYLSSIGADLGVLRTMLRAAPSDMNYLSNDDAIAFGILVFDEKKNRLIDPDLILDRLDRSKVARASAGES